VAHRTWQKLQIFALEASDRSLNAMPLFHGHGTNGILLPSLAAGGSVVLLDTLDPRDFFAALDRFDPTWYSCSPVFHEAILELAPVHQEAVEASRLRFIRTASYRMPEEVSSRLETVFGAPLVEEYGCSEAATITSNRVPPGRRKRGSAGVPFENLVVIVDSSGRPVSSNQSGEILVSGPGVFEGYEDDAEANAAAFIDGWFRTGDLGRCDSEGFFTIVGRVKETINRGGEKVSPQEVEEVLLSHRAVREAACFGIPHPTLSEEVGAAVVLRKGSKVTDSELRQLVQSQLIRFKVPRRILRLDALPRGPAGKLERRKLLHQSEEVSAVERGLKRSRLSSLETSVAALWRDILGVEVRSPEDDFFLLGGDSLRAMRLIAAVREEFGQELSIEQVFEEAATVSGLAQLIRARRRQKAGEYGPSRIPRGEIPGLCPLSFAQERLWFLSHLDPDSRSYNIGGGLRIRGPLNGARLRAAIECIFSRHEPLRTTFGVIDGSPHQIVAPKPCVSLPLIDLSDYPAEEQEDVLHRVAVQEVRRPYDLEKGPLIRTVLLRLRADHHVLLVPKHHAVFDGISGRIFTQELTAFYEEFELGRTATVPELSVSYREYAVWQRKQIQADRFEQNLDYWRQHLSGAPTLLELHTDFPRPATQSFRGAKHWFDLPRELVEKLRSLARGAGTTLFNTLLAAFYVLLYRYTDRQDLVVGSFVNERDHGIHTAF
jgi:acyl carrier protein